MGKGIYLYVFIVTLPFLLVCVGLVISALRQRFDPADDEQASGISSGRSRSTLSRTINGIDMKIADDSEHCSVVTASLSFESSGSPLLADGLQELQQRLGVSREAMRIEGATLVVRLPGKAASDVIWSDLDAISQFALAVRNERLDELCNTVHTSGSLTARRAALDLLAACLPSHEKTREAFLSVLDDGLPGLRLDAAVFLARTDRRPLVELIADTTALADHRLKAIDALAGYTDEARVRFGLFDTVESESAEELRVHALNLLLDEGCRIPRELCRDLAERTESEALLAAKALGRSHVKPDVETLFDLMNRPEPLVQAESIDALGKVGRTSDVPVLREARRKSAHRGAIDRAIRRIQTREQGDRGSLSLSDQHDGGELSMSSQEGALTLENETSKHAVSEAEELEVTEPADG